MKNIKEQSYSYFHSATLLMMGVFAFSIGNPANADSLNEIAQKSKSAPVPQRVQVGGTCGLYALGMVMDYWHTLNPTHPTALVANWDLKGPGVQFNFMPTVSERIYDYARANGYTSRGEMFDASLLASTANHFGYQAYFYPKASLAQIYRILDKKHPAIIAFDVDDMGNPTLSNGMRAHYAVLEGYFDYQGTRYVVARHGWGTQKDYIWKAKELFASMKNLKCTGYYKTLEEPSMLHLPQCPGREDLLDISDSLADKIIEVVPPDETPAGGSEIAEH